MVTNIDLAVAEAKRKTRLSDAEQWRLIRLAEAGRRPRQSTRNRLLSWTGERLIGAGTYLQNRYGECVEAAQEACTCGRVDSVPTAW